MDLQDRMVVPRAWLPTAFPPALQWPADFPASNLAAFPNAHSACRLYGRTDGETGSWPGPWQQLVWQCARRHLPAALGRPSGSAALAAMQCEPGAAP